MKYYHGGPKGLMAILPRTRTGAKGQRKYGNRVALPQKVYVTTDFHAALMYASQFKKGSVYTVHPNGEIKPDPDCTLNGLSFECDSADILNEQRIAPSTLSAIRLALAE